MKKLDPRDVVLLISMQDAWESLLEECFDMGHLDTDCEMVQLDDGCLRVSVPGDRLAMTVPQGGWRLR